MGQRLPISMSLGGAKAAGDNLIGHTRRAVKPVGRRGTADRMETWRSTCRLYHL